MNKFSIDLHENDIENSFLNRKLWKFISYIALIAIITIFFALAQNAYKYNTFPTNIDDIPLYKAEMTPYRSKPLDPGGEVFENQDMLVYNNLIEKKSTQPNTKQKTKVFKKPAKKVSKPQEKTKNANNPFEFLNQDN